MLLVQNPLHVTHGPPCEQAMHLGYVIKQHMQRHTEAVQWSLRGLNSAGVQHQATSAVPPFASDGLVLPDRLHPHDLTG